MLAVVTVMNCSCCNLLLYTTVVIFPTWWLRLNVEWAAEILIWRDCAGVCWDGAGMCWRCTALHTFFPTCQVRVVRFYVGLFSFSFLSSSSFSSSSSLSDLNHDLVSSVWHAGPQPRSCEFSVACRTPTASSWVQCGVPDPNGDPASSVWRAGPQPRSREFSVACRTSTAILRVQCGVPDPNRELVSSVWRVGPQLWSKGLVVVAERVCQRSSCKMSQDKSERMSEDMSARSADRTLCSSGGFDEHRNSDSLEKVEAIPGCSSARNHNSHANMHACCAFVRGSLGSASHTQNRKLQKRTGDGFLQAWPCGWHVLGEHCPQHGGKGT